MNTTDIEVRRDYKDCINYHNNGVLRCKARLRLIENKLYNPDGPAIRFWNEEGQLIHEAYYIDDKLHRKDGPALKRWDENIHYEVLLMIN